MLALVDYGAGNVRSVQKALLAVGADVTLTQDPQVVLAAEKVVLPGVGAFADCMSALWRLGMVEALGDVVDRGTPFLGICVGMQVLFEVGEEMGSHAGLGVLPGRVVRFELEPPLKVPHTGWNQVVPVVKTPLLADIPEGAWAYFNHGYYCQAQPEHVLATADYGGAFACLVGKGKTYGVQFHPEKSQQVGLQLLRNFVERVS